MKKRLVVLTGAGMSAESGIPTFRGGDGLWENHRIEDVATPQGWQRNPDLVLRFYNERRKAVLDSIPNRGHRILAELEEQFDVSIITQNIDNLHERAGSKNVLHLHGEITKARSSVDANYIQDIVGCELKKGWLCPDGLQMRPFIVWFGEDVPLMEMAGEITRSADLFVVVGTSLQVYPAAFLIHDVMKNVPRFIIDPIIPQVEGTNQMTAIPLTASEGLHQLKQLLLASN